MVSHRILDIINYIRPNNRNGINIVTNNLNTCFGKVIFNNEIFTDISGWQVYKSIRLRGKGFTCLWTPSILLYKEWYTPISTKQIGQILIKMELTQTNWIPSKPILLIFLFSTASISSQFPLWKNNSGPPQRERIKISSLEGIHI